MRCEISSGCDSLEFFYLRFQVVKVPIFGGFPVESPTNTANRLRALLRGISLSEYSSERFRVRLRRLSEYGSVACLVERPPWETLAEQYSDTVLFWRKQKRSDPEIHAPPPQNRRSTSRVQNWRWCVFCLSLRFLRDGGTTIKIYFFAFEGGGGWGQGGKSSKNAVFRGKYHDNKI